MSKIFFQSSLPRAGSTLLQNILGQNPNFYVTPTSGVLELLFAARGSFTSSQEFKAQDSILMESGFKNFCKSGLKGFYKGVTDKPYVLDKSRGWGVHYEFLNSFYPDPKIICMVRNPVDIYTSMEKNFRKHQLKSSGIVNWSTGAGTTIEKRLNIWKNTPPVGLAFERLLETVNRGLADNIMFIKYEDLCTVPNHIIPKLYKFLGVEEYKHDLLNITQITQEDDSVYGIFGDHEIRPKLTLTQSTAVSTLGLHNCVKIVQEYEWFYKYFQYSTELH